MKNKLESAYNPDKSGRKEKVVLGLSGGIDSLVTAYLLKIQKYDVVAVTVVPSWEGPGVTSAEVLSCHITPAKVEEIKEFCQRLNIPLQIVKASADFQNSVVEPWVADRIMGRRSRPCWNCHELRMNLIFEKMKELGVQKIATGHYAKLFVNKVNGSVFVHTSNDEVFDQASLLSRIDREILRRLVLPLSDLTKKEVLKLAENFGLVSEQKDVSIHQCLTSRELSQYITQNVPKRFLKEGEIMSPDGTHSYGHHEGVQDFVFGEAVEVKESGKVFKGVMAGYNYAEKKILVADPSFFNRESCLLIKCELSEGVSIPEPLRAFVTLAPDQVAEAWIYPKSLSSVFLEFFEPQKILAGEIVTVMKKKGKNAKVLLTGQIRIVPVPLNKEEGEKNIPKFNHSIDF